jgi:signal transduction histidine kinase/DNA-binding response OmpR family regulator
MDGTRFRSAPEAGFCFPNFCQLFCLFPIVDGAPSGENIVAMETKTIPTNTNAIRILVVDDHPNTASTLARALAQLGAGVHVTSATSGHEALTKVKDSAVDILITDMIMPEMTGLELIEKLQNHPGGRPAYTYLVTAYDVPGLKVTANRLKVNDVIIKPVRPERICQIATNAIEEMKHSTKPNKAADTGKRKFKILVADDRPDNVTLLARYLEYEGYDQVTAMDGIDALNKVRDELPDLVLLDVNMPNKDGFEVLEDIRADPAIAHTPVIILTAARLDPADVQSGLNLGADDYVTKPFDRHELMARIRTKLRVKEAEDVIRRRNRELNLLPEIGKELSARLDIKDLANVLLKRTVETLGAEHGRLLIFNGSQVVESFHVSALSSGADSRLTLSDKIINYIQDIRQGLIIDDARHDPLWEQVDTSSLRSAVIAPLNGRRQLLGLLILTHEQEKYFHTEHLLLLQAIASQAAIAIENAHLYADMVQEEKRLAAVLHHAAEAILLFDQKGNLTLLNPTAEKLFTDFKANLHQPLPAERGYDAFIQLLQDVQKSQQSTSAEILWPDKRTFSVLLTPIEDGGQVVTLHDVSHFKDLEQVKNEFIATASHDLKNPIAVITGFSALLAQAGPLNEQQTSFVERIKNASQTMNELVQNMLSLAQLDLKATPKYKPVEIKDLLDEMEEEFKPQAVGNHQAFELTSLASALHVNGDPLQLRQMLRNLINNAIKYTPQGGSIRVRAAENAGQLVIEVEDNGYGIPATDLPFIFNRFYRVRNGKNSEIEGNGLGLAIVKSIVDQHGGQISVTSEPGNGSCFTVTLAVV